MTVRFTGDAPTPEDLLGATEKFYALTVMELQRTISALSAGEFNEVKAAQAAIRDLRATALQVFFTGGGPKTTALTPIVIAHATAIGANPLVFALVLGMNMQHQYLLPVSNMPNAVINGTNHVKSSELMRTGACVSILAASFFSVVVYTYWKWIGVL